MMAPNSGAQATGGVKPLFLKARDISEPEKPLTTREICGAAEARTGFGSMLGAQNMGSIWRLYPNSHAARLQLLMSGIVLRKAQVSLHDENPYVIRNPDGSDNKVASTKVFISNVPISFSNDEIEKAIISTGVTTLSRLVDENDRDDTGKLTRWKTGRRFIYIAIPSTPLPQRMTMGPFSARIYHREQRLSQHKTCGNCLMTGHVRSECQSDVVCRQCKQTGHKAGDQLCGQEEQGARGSREVTAPVSTINNGVLSDGESGAETENEAESVNKTKQRDRGSKRKQRLSPPPTEKAEDEKTTPERDAKLHRADEGDSESDT